MKPVEISKAGLIFLAVGGYWVSSIATVFFNKHLLNQSSLNYAIILCQNIISATLSAAYLHWSAPGGVAEVLQLPTRTKKLLAGMSVTYVLMLALNNICLRLVMVTFFQVVRSLNLVSSVFFTYLMLGQTTSSRCLGACALLMFGFWLSVQQEKASGTTSIEGILSGVLASMAAGFQGCLMKKVINSVAEIDKGNAEIIISLATNAMSLALLPFCILGSGEAWPEESTTSSAGSGLYLFSEIARIGWPVFVSGVLTFFVLSTSLLSIRYTSPLSHNISVHSKAVMQTLLAAFYYSEFKSTLWWCGNLTVACAAIFYTYLKFDENKNRERAVSVTTIRSSSVGDIERGDAKNSPVV